jgi:hypothetical protein
MASEFTYIERFFEWFFTTEVSCVLRVVWVVVWPTKPEHKCCIPQPKIPRNSMIDVV